MNDVFITPITGTIPKKARDYSRENFIDQNKTNFLNKILRGEISAVEAYEQVIPSIVDVSDRFHLSEIRNEHDRNVEKLKILVEHSRFVPEEDSGSWGKVVTTVVGAAKLMGSTFSLKTLHEGEEHGLKLYNEALNYNLTEEEQDVIKNDIIPGIKRHIASLEILVSNQNDD